jgi:cell division protein FtsN
MSSENKPQEQATARAESTAPTPALPEPQTAQAPPAVASPPGPNSGETLPQSQSASSPPGLDNEAQRFAEISPSAAPADVAAAQRYWVEFGAYDTAFYADRLKRNLGEIDIDAMVGGAPGKHGRHYLRVRTTNDSDRATAQHRAAPPSCWRGQSNSDSYA